MNKKINPNLDQNLKYLKELSNEILYIQNQINKLNKYKKDLNESSNGILYIQNQINKLNKYKKELANKFIDIFKNNIIYDFDIEIMECLNLLENENLGGKNE